MGKFIGPEKYKPISGWGYVARDLLYMIPIVGWIFLIIHAICAKNINTRKYARAHFCWLLIEVIALAILAVLVLILGSAILDAINESSVELPEFITNFLEGLQ